MSIDYSNFLLDMGFLSELNAYRVKNYDIRIAALDFSTERVLSSLQGKITGGSMSYSASSATRKTGSLTAVFDEDTYNITSVNNLIAIDKKISISIGIPNPFFNTTEYQKYGETLWFKQGTFIITNATSSISTSGASISITFIDKMGMLNGTCGGAFPSAVVFNEELVYDTDGNSTTEYPLISEIIRELVHHYGGENYSKIIIDDLADYGRWVATWAHSTPVRFAANSGAFIVTNSPTEQQLIDFPNQKICGDDVGYLSTELTYPGDLIGAIGDNVCSILDTIVSTLGNYEYFYDVDGYFHFQAIKNFNTTGSVPTIVDNLDSSSVFNINDETDSTFQNQYLLTYSEDEFLNEYAGLDSVISVGLNPSYSNIKNDFVVWGTKSDGDVEKAVRYHLAIDSRPKYDPDTSLCKKTIWCVRNLADHTISRYVAVDRTPDKDGVYEIEPDIRVTGASAIGHVNYRGFYYDSYTYYYDGVGDSVQVVSTVEVTGEDGTVGTESFSTYYCLIEKSTNYSISGISPGTTEGAEYWQEIPSSEEEVLLHSPSLDWFGDNGFDWREELYRRALIAYGTSTEGSYYDAELLAEWRYIFNPCAPRLDPMYSTNDPDADGGYVNPYWSTFEDDWQDHFGQPILDKDTGIESNPVPWQGYIIDVISAPANIGYWLDIIDASSSLGAYSVEKIGRRTVAEENGDINEVLNREVPDILFIDGTQDQEDIDTATAEALSTGQTYLVMQSTYISYLSTRSSYGSCYEDIRSLLYSHLIYNASVSLTSIPILYLDVNKIVRLSFSELGIAGNFVINTISFDFSSMASMSLSLTEAIVVI